MKLEIRSSASRLSWRVGGRLRFLERRRRARFEAALLPPGAEQGPVHGFCFVCGVPSVFPMDAEHSWMEGGVRRLNWRERLICPTCGLNCRMRAGLHLIDLVLKPGQGSAIYATEQLTAFFSHLQKRYPWAVGSEYLGPDFPRGALDERGLRHETVEDLSFGDATLDLLITEDVMEHVAEPVRALQEFSRVLKPGGVLLLSVPFDERRRVTVSTSGLVPQMDRLAAECPVALAVSLHAPDDALRDRLVPVNRRHPLADLMAACRRYLEVAPRDFVTFEYVMLDGVNDAPAQADALVHLVRDVPCKFNLIPFNPFPGTAFAVSPRARILAFQRRLMDAGIVTTIRKTRGEDIDAACGQLAGRVKNRVTRPLATRIVAARPH